MIDFRYHIVSIVAIFLALAVGIVLGSGPLEDDIGGFIEERTNQLADQKVELQSEIGLLRNQAEAANTYAELVQPSVVRNLLDGQAVALMILPDADAQSVDAIAESISAAGGTVTERVTITDAWTQDDQQPILERLTDGLARDGWPADSTPTAGDVLAAALLTDNERLAGQPYAPATGVLAAYVEAGFVEIEEETISRAGSVMVVGSDLPDRATALVWQDFIQAFADTGAAELVVGPTLSAASGGVVGQVRESDLADVVSTVDWIESAPGVTTCVLALTVQLRGTVGHYGTGPGASGPAPDPVPVN